MTTLRAAQSSDSSTLSKLAFDSEKYWGYSDDYMERFKRFYSVTDSFIRQNHVFVLEDNNQAVGFFALTQADSLWELEYFYISANRIKSGYGRILWQELIHFCKGHSIQTFKLVTSPQAVGFYEKMGAEVTSHTTSLISSERIIPVLKYTVSPAGFQKITG